MIWLVIFSYSISIDLDHNKLHVNVNRLSFRDLNLDFLLMGFLHIFNLGPWFLILKKNEDSERPRLVTPSILTAGRRRRIGDHLLHRDSNQTIYLIKDTGRKDTEERHRKAISIFLHKVPVQEEDIEEDNGAEGFDDGKRIISENGSEIDSDVGKHRRNQRQ